MKWHRVRAVVEKAIRDVEIELTSLGEGERNQWNEDREALQSELQILKTLDRTLENWYLERNPPPGTSNDGNLDLASLTQKAD